MNKKIHQTLFWLFSSEEECLKKAHLFFFEIVSPQKKDLTHLVEMVSNNLPDSRPLQPDAAHVIVGDLHYFLQAEHARVCGRGQLVHGHGAQPAHKINWWMENVGIEKKSTLIKDAVTHNDQNNSSIVPILEPMGL